MWVSFIYLGSIDSLVSLILMWSSEWTISWMVESIVCATLDVQHFDHDHDQSIDPYCECFKMVFENKLFNFNTKYLNQNPQMDAIKLQYFILFSLSFGVIRWLRLNQFFLVLFLYSFVVIDYGILLFFFILFCFVLTQPLEVSIWFISNCYIITLEFILKANKFVAFIYLLLGEKMKSF